MKISYADEFRKTFYDLPGEIRDLYREQEDRFRKNWRDPRLHVKKLKDHPFPFSFRITRRYRVLFAFIDINTVLFGTIGHRKDNYR